VHGQFQTEAPEHSGEITWKSAPVASCGTGYDLEHKTVTRWNHGRTYASLGALRVTVRDDARVWNVRAVFCMRSDTARRARAGKLQATLHKITNKFAVMVPQNAALTQS
jgi:hypothetical protein